MGFSLTNHRRQKRRRVAAEQRPGLAFTLQELWDFDMVANILERKSSFLRESGELDYEAEALLMAIRGVAPASRSTQAVAVEYYMPEASVSSGIRGRVTGQGLMGAPGWIRRLCSHKYYHDVDIVNCFPVLLLQLADKVDVYPEPVQLKEYVEDRENILRRDMDQVQGLTRKEAKQQYLKAMFGGSEFSYSTTFLRQFKEEIENIRGYLWRLPNFRHIRDYAEQNRRENSNVEASFLSLVINVMERQVIDTAMKRMGEEDMGYRVDVYVYDGFMVRKKRGVDRIPVEHLTMLSEAVLEQTGYKVEFDEKSLTPRLEDIEHIYPSFNNPISRSVCTAENVFVDIADIAKILNKEPRPENVANFKMAIIPLLNKAFAKYNGQKALILERELGDRGPNHIVYARKPHTDMMVQHRDKTYFIDNGEKKIKINAMKEWYGSPYALTYKKIVFNPRPLFTPGAARPLDLNTFVGIAFPQKRQYTAEECRQLEQNELKLFLQHLKEIVCHGDEELFEYCFNWMWSKVTRPWHRINTALVMRSKEGAGKGVVVEKIAQILGCQYMSKPSSLENITGTNFNKQYFESCLVMFLDEAFYAGSKATKNQVKTLITDEWVTVNEKFMPMYQIENFSSMVLASNERHVINTDVESRRFVVMQVSNQRAGVHAEGSEGRNYFNSVIGTDPQLLSDYLHSIEGAPNWSGRDIPRTVAMEKQAIMSFNSLENFLLDVMRSPILIACCRLEYLKINPKDRDQYEPDPDKDPLEGVYGKHALYKYYLDNYRGGHQARKVVFYDYISEVISGFVETEANRYRLAHGQQEYFCSFPPIEVAREQYKIGKGFIHMTFP